ncbi:MAG: MFS transporter [bacterium]
MRELAPLFIPVRLVGNFARSFHPAELPPMLRRTYGRELVSWAFLPLMLGAIEGGAIAVVVKKAFEGQPGVSPAWLDLATAWALAAPNVANLTSFIWAALARGRPKVPFISGLQIAACILVASIALFPRNAAGLLAVCIALGLARTAWTGVITIRAAVWRNNYPNANRATIAGKLATVQSLFLAAAGLVVGRAMDWSPDNYHYLFPLLALCGLIGNNIYRKVRLRRARALQRAEIDGRKRDSGFNPMGMVTLLREDRLYARFMWWMSVFGFGNLMLMAPMTFVVTDEFKLDYTQGILVNAIIPLLVMPFAIPLWAKLMDASHIIHFRSLHGWTFVLASAAVTLASYLHSIELLYAGAFLLGVGYAGGTLAWNLGHQDFATAERDADYMAVHVTLNGIRGILAPVAAWALHTWLAPRGHAPLVLVICTVVNAIGVLGFMSLRKFVSPTKGAPLPTTAAA